MLQNVTFLAIVAIHTAETEPLKVRQVMNKIHRNVGARRAPAGGRSRSAPRGRGRRRAEPLQGAQRCSPRRCRRELRRR